MKVAIFGATGMVASAGMSEGAPLFPGYVTTTANVGRALIQLAAQGYPQRIIYRADINRLALESTLHASVTNAP
ncbi:MAG: hypothetical protein ACREL3_05130 [Gemmatimonadales bacterium]